MSLSVFLLRWFGVMLSLCGGMALFQRLGLKSAFLPLVTVSSVSVLIFLGGVCRILYPAAMVVYAAGLICFCIFFGFAVARKFSFSFLKEPGTLFFFGSSLLLIPLLWNVLYFHYDNFSHWGTVLFEMLSFNSFPTEETIVVFRDYPTGTASFLYFFCKFTGQTEGISLIGQGMLCCAGLTGMFSGVKKWNSSRFFGRIFLCLALFSYLVFDDGTLHVYNLLVDALIAFLVLGGWFLCKEYRDDPSHAAVWLLPVVCFLCVIKSSAMLFALLLCGYLFVNLLRAWKRNGNIRRVAVLLPIAGGAGMYLSWFAYTRFAYRPSLSASTGAEVSALGRNSGRAVTISLIQKLRGEVEARGGEFYRNLFRLMGRKLTDLSQVYVWVSLLLIFLTVFVCLILRKKKRSVKPFLCRALTGFFVYLFYILMLLLMYCFIMSPGESSYAAAFERYIITPLILWAGLVGIGAMDSLNAVLSGKRAVQWFSAIGIALLLLIPAWKGTVQLVVRPDFASIERGVVYPMLREGAEVLPRNARMAMYNGSRGRADLYYYLMCYELKSRACCVLECGQPETEDNLHHLESRFDYLILAVKDEWLFDRISECGYEFQYREGCSVYRIESQDFGSAKILPVGSFE